MCVDIHARSLCLLQKHFQITEIMSGDQNSRIIPDTDIYFGDLRISVSFCICLIEQSHHLNAVLASFQRKGCKVFGCK